MELKEYFPMWEKLTPAQQSRLLSASDLRNYKKSQIVHNGLTDCTGLFLIQSGQLRAYTISDEGREITMYRLFERDICLFSASCIVRSIQFDIVIEAEIILIDIDSTHVSSSCLVFIYGCILSVFPDSFCDIITEGKESISISHRYILPK
ncbi:MAG: hypothetical protein LUG27_01365 [Clostridiales bacterium]|nr:hypothetical protein [Clostridiales bacterium]